MPSRALCRTPHGKFLTLNALPFHKETADERNSARGNGESVSPCDGNIIRLQDGR